MKNNNVSKGITVASFSEATGQLWKARVSLDIIRLSPKCNESYYLSSNSSNSGHNSPLILTPSSTSHAGWKVFSTNNFAEITDLALISFSDQSHSGCAGHLNYLSDEMAAMSGLLSTMRSSFIGYNENTFMSSYQLSEVVSKSRFFFIRTHGNADSNGPYMNLNSVSMTGGFYGTQEKYYYDDLPDMTPCDCAFFFVCHSADGISNDLYAEIFLTYAVDQSNAWTAIGFEGTISCDFGELFMETFISRLATGVVPSIAFSQTMLDDCVMSQHQGIDFPVFVSDSYINQYDSDFSSIIRIFR